MKKEIWKSPHLEKSLDEAQVPLWFWNDKLDKDELIRQLKLKTEIGVTCTNPHARRNGGEGYIGGYLDDQWFDDIKTVLEYKKEHSEKMWLYDEIDWPAGTCDKTITLDERNREQYITIQRIDIAPQEIFRAQFLSFEGGGLFGIGPETDKSEMAFNIQIIDTETEDTYDLTDYLIYDMFGPELEFQDKRPAAAFITKIHTDAYDSGGCDQVNYLDANATKAFLASTYDKYYHHFSLDFGKSITTVFNDETRMCNPIPWSRTFAQVFKEQKKYDIRKELFRLILKGERAGRIRIDYYDVLAYLFQTNYFGEIHNWCKTHDLKLFAHLLGEETLFGHTRYSGDYMRQNRWQDVCGADHLGKGIGSLNIKFTACGAHSYGKKRTAVEVFAGCGWDMTFDEYCRMITWMFQQGMHTIINHGFFYSDRGKRKDDWPPSQFFQWKGWEHQAKGNAMIRRLNYALTDGINEADVLVYFPIESYWLHHIPDQNYTHAFFHGALEKDEEAARIDRETQFILNGLSSENLDFDLIHQDAIENFRVKNNKIVNEKSGQKFSVLLLPMCEVLPVKMARLCEQFAKSGGKIIAIDKLPCLSTDKQSDAEVIAIIKQLKRDGKLLIISSEDKSAVYKAVQSEIPHPVKIINGTRGTYNNHPAYVPYLIDPYMHTGEDLSGVLFTRYLKEGKRNTLFMNYSTKPDIIEVQIEAGEEVPEVWDTFTGEITKAAVVRKVEAGHIIRLELPCHHGVFVVSRQKE